MNQSQWNNQGQVGYAGQPWLIEERDACGVGFIADDYLALVRRNVHHKITNGESYRDLLRRTTSELSNILRRHPGQRIAIFSHTGAICFMTLHLMGAIRPDTKQTPWLVTSNCGINRFEIRGKNNIRVLAINDTRHLSEITGNDAFASR
ncbi:histidine phosphatase family protein [Leptolyngbya sp. 7M]|uniref:histidine phosphatase family protein n=1 Tax=Leptolyngbya sp. 7M TaxID=2812896 RepID=UPI001B8C72B1|nr:histidine phosphatase family protein [Leptolyngbya sp. 7M]QYO62953.1 histidine phosphatase family protein [Leptolyngbya sp. 7M]